MRLPSSVHDAGDRASVPALIGIAHRAGFSAFSGDGANRWPAVHRLDAAPLFRLALEHAEPGARLHAVTEEGIPLRTIAQAIGAGLGLPARSVIAEDAPAHFDWLASFAILDNPISSALTRIALDWYPQQQELLNDMRDSGYF